jgi:hypothetical protein
VFTCKASGFYMRPRSTPSPKGSVYPQNDVATYRDLLLFEERLKTTAASLQRRKSRYQRTVCLLVPPPSHCCHSLSLSTTVGYTISTRRGPPPTRHLPSRHSMQVGAEAVAARPIYRGDRGPYPPLFFQRPALRQRHNPCTILCKRDVLGQDFVREQVSWRRSSHHPLTV